ncbi:MAG: hypothetical protein ABIG66_01910 [Candidatus Kerfeldbacteria bacterium]
MAEDDERRRRREQAAEGEEQEGSPVEKKRTGLHGLVGRVQDVFSENKDVAKRVQELGGDMPDDIDEHLSDDDPFSESRRRELAPHEAYEEEPYYETPEQRKTRLWAEGHEWNKQYEAAKLERQGQAFTDENIERGRRDAEKRRQSKEDHERWLERREEERQAKLDREARAAVRRRYADKYPGLPLEQAIEKDREERARKASEDARWEKAMESFAEGLDRQREYAKRQDEAARRYQKKEVLGREHEAYPGEYDAALKKRRLEKLSKKLAEEERVDAAYKKARNEHYYPKPEEAALEQRVSKELLTAKADMEAYRKIIEQLPEEPFGPRDSLERLYDTIRKMTEDHLGFKEGDISKQRYIEQLCGELALKIYEVAQANNIDVNQEGVVDPETAELAAQYVGPETSEPTAEDKFVQGQLEEAGVDMDHFQELSSRPMEAEGFGSRTALHTAYEALKRTARSLTEEQLLYDEAEKQGTDKFMMSKRRDERDAVQSDLEKQIDDLKYQVFEAQQREASAQRQEQERIKRAEQLKDWDPYKESTTKEHLERLAAEEADPTLKEARLKDEAEEDRQMKLRNERMKRLKDEWDPYEETKKEFLARIRKEQEAA